MEYCTQCLKASKMLLPVYDYMNEQKSFLCPECLMSTFPINDDLAELDAQIILHEDTVNRAKVIADSYEDQGGDDLPDEIASFAMNPLKLYSFSRNLLEGLLAQRRALLNRMKEEDRLAYELKKSVEVEDYELAAKIRDRLIELKEDRFKKG